MKNLTCKTCNKQYQVHNYRAKISSYCSVKCKGVGFRGVIPSSAFKKGSTPWNKGKKGVQIMSEKTKKKLSISIRKAYENPELRKRLSEMHKGEKSYLWKGGITTENQMQRVVFRNKMRKQVMERDDYTCQMCDKRGGVLHVDHIQSWSEYVELRFSMDNCRTLCEDCHYFVTWGKRKPAGMKTWGRNTRSKEVSRA